LKSGRQRELLSLIALIIFLYSMALLAKLTFGLPFDLYRYLLPPAFAFCLYTLGALAREYVQSPSTETYGLPPWRMKIAVALGAIILLCQSISLLGPSVQDGFRILWALNARNEMWTNPLGPTHDDKAGEDYRKAFAKIPVGSRVLIALDYPYLLDYKKYSIFSIDQSGAASPSPGFPYFRGPAPVKAYLLSQHIDYIAHVPFDSSLFLHSREISRRNAISTFAVYRFFSKFEQDFSNNVDQLAGTQSILFDSPDIRVIDLKSDQHP
jgi:hypothetical protein